MILQLQLAIDAQERSNDDEACFEVIEDGVEGENATIEQGCTQ
jgi:hypothetical protein